MIFTAPEQRESLIVPGHRAAHCNQVYACLVLIDADMEIQSDHYTMTGFPDIQSKEKLLIVEKEKEIWIKDFRFSNLV